MDIFLMYDIRFIAKNRLMSKNSFCFCFGILVTRRSKGRSICGHLPITTAKE